MHTIPAAWRYCYTKNSDSGYKKTHIILNELCQYTIKCINIVTNDNIINASGTTRDKKITISSFEVPSRATWCGNFNGGVT